jgi:hypothetical protein
MFSIFPTFDPCGHVLSVSSLFSKTWCEALCGICCFMIALSQARVGLTELLISMTGLHACLVVPADNVRFDDDVV